MKCQICNKECKTIGSLGNHIVKYHENLKNYYDNFLKKETEGKCKVCGKDTKYYRLNVGYRTTCGRVCSRKLMSMTESRNKAKQTIFEKFGVENPSQIETVRKTISEKARLRMSDEKERRRISILTKLSMSRPEIKKRHLDNLKPMSLENKNRLSEFMKLKHLEIGFKEKFYSKERNRKISEAKKRYWASHPEEKIRVGNIWKSWKNRDEVGWMNHLKRASKLGFEKIYSPDGDTSLEIKIYSMLEKEGIKFIKKYELNNKIYDAYLIEKNILLEFDGDFWHKKTLGECKYKYQIDSFYNDIVKNDIAKNNNIKLIRILEKNIPNTITELL